MNENQALNKLDDAIAFCESSGFTATAISMKKVRDELYQSYPSLKQQPVLEPI